MSVIGFIPSRFASTRFPGKPLVDISGKTMIQRVYEQAVKAELLDHVYVATDNQNIFDHVLDFGGSAIITSEEHKSGTDRCMEAVESLEDEIDVVINIQGDEPFINPGQIDELVSCFSDDSVELATLIKKIVNWKDIFNENRPKVIIDENSNAIYFSRSPIPYQLAKKNEDWLNDHRYYKHIGMYGYRTKTLKKITSLEQSSLEIAESLEQLRWIQNGFAIRTAETTFESWSIDTPQDLDEILKKFDDQLI